MEEKQIKIETEETMCLYKSTLDKLYQNTYMLGFMEGVIDFNYDEQTGEVRFNMNNYPKLKEFMLKDKGRA